MKHSVLVMRTVVVASAAIVVAAGAALAGRRPGRAEDGARALSASIDFFEQRLRRDPTSALDAHALADRYLSRFQVRADTRDVERAERLTVRALPLTKDSAAALSRLSAIQLTQHRFAEAFASATAARRVDSLHEGAIGALFDAAMNLGREALAESLLVMLDPGSIGRLVRTAHFAGSRRDWEIAYAAQRQVCSALERTGARPQAVAWCRTELGAVQRQRMGSRAAAYQYRRALAAYPGYRGALEGLADLALARGDLDEAERLYGRIAVDAHADLYLRLAEVWRARGDGERATALEDTFLRIATAPGGEALYARELALLLARRGELDSAFAVATREAARRPLGRKSGMGNRESERTGAGREPNAARRGSDSRFPIPDSR